jgi:hypothetical protein
VRTIRQSRSFFIHIRRHPRGEGGRHHAARHRRLDDFSSCFGRTALCPDDTAFWRPAARAWGLAVGDSFLAGFALGRRDEPQEINFDGIVGPSHNYAGLSVGNIASATNLGSVSYPRQAALQGVEKMRANLRLGLAQGFLMPLDRPNRPWLREMGVAALEVPETLRPAAFSASAMWAANAATVSPAPDTADGRCHLTVANLRTMAHRSHEWTGTLAQLRLAFADESHFAVHPPVPPTFGDEGAANHMRLTGRHDEQGVRCSSMA